MANTIVGNAAADLSGKFLSVDGAKIGSLTRTNAQVLTLPTNSPVEIVAAKSNTLLIPVWSVVITNFAAGAYTNVSPTGYMTVKNNADTVRASDFLYNLASESITDFTDILSATSAVAYLGPYQKLSASQGEVIGKVQSVTSKLGNIELTVSNAALGNFTGGNAANSMKVIVGYIEVAIL